MQQDIATTRSIEGRDGPALTIGLDVGDRYTHVCVLGSGGEVVRERRVRTTAAGAQRRTGGPPAGAGRARGGAALAVAEPPRGGPRPRGGRRQPSPGRADRRSQRKTDRLDAAWLARLGRFDPELLAPIRHRSEQSQHDLAVVRARDALVRSRTLLINHVRGAVKACGAALPSCTAEAFHRKTADHIPDGLRPALLPLVEAIGELTVRASRRPAGRSRRCARPTPRPRALRQVTGVGPITALTFVLTIEDPGRFPKNREVGAYLGLVPRQRESGERAPQLGHQQERRPGPAAAAGAGRALHPRPLRARYRPAPLG